MNGALRHDQLRPLLEAEALDALSAKEHALLAAHLPTCPECQRELAVLRATVGSLGALLPPALVPPERMERVRARLLARAAAECEASFPVPVASLPSRHPGPGWNPGRWAGWSVAAGLAALLVSHHAFHEPLAFGWTAAAVLAALLVTTGAYAGSLRGQMAALPQQAGGAEPIPIGSAKADPARYTPWLMAAALAVLSLGLGGYAASLRSDAAALRGALTRAETEQFRSASALAERERLVAALAAPSTRVIDLASTTERAPSGRMFWDPATDRWTFFAQNLAAAPEGRVYQLWLVTPEGPISAGTFQPGGDGSATLRAEYELAPDALRAVAVSEEPAGGVAAPTGPIVIAGELGR